MTRTASSRRRLGALSTLALLLAGSAVIRFAGGPGAAIARDVDPTTAFRQEAACTAEIEEVLTAFEGREAAISAREDEVNARLEELRALRTEISAGLAELETLEADLSRRLAIAETAAEDDVKKLTDVYSAMKPKDAATLFEEMDPEFAAGFVARMKPQAAAAVMAGLDAQTAYRLSVILAARHAQIGGAPGPTGN